MKLKLSMALAASAMLPLAVFAVSPHMDTVNPANPAINGPTPKYESAFHGYQPWKDAQEAPTKTWRAMNDNVTQPAGGMAGMNMGKGGASDTMSMPADHVMRHKGK